MPGLRAGFATNAVPSELIEGQVRSQEATDLPPMPRGGQARQDGPEKKAPRVSEVAIEHVIHVPGSVYLFLPLFSHHSDGYADMCARKNEKLAYTHVGILVRAQKQDALHEQLKS